MHVEGLEKIKTVVYARVSTDKQELDTQINAMCS
jgi:predicted site-specific integrase-resolvase